MKWGIYLIILSHIILSHFVSLKISYLIWLNKLSLFTCCTLRLIMIEIICIFYDLKRVFHLSRVCKLYLLCYKKYLLLMQGLFLKQTRNANKILFFIIGESNSHLFFINPQFLIFLETVCLDLIMRDMF